ncbi:MAG TPA: hypothetical protein ACHBZA_06640 [Arsenophonus apicola]|uniref:hypothetical protein n=1 Tax=Arsenophonus apicola TaxID=2879119 RepID=UPI001CDC2BA3|nr:hypothetical protein [Arsenophonus apicola]UBX30725.1 hypothetical protein LDL57_15825 [Arsenophonus apicola]
MGYFSDDLFDITFTEEIEQSQEWDNFLLSVKQRMPKITKIFVKCYRGCTAITEVIIHYSDEKILLVTIFSDDLNFSPVSDEDIKANHKQVSLPNAADVLIFITKLAQQFKLAPSLVSEPDSSDFLVFNSK